MWDSFLDEPSNKPKRLYSGQKLEAGAEGVREGAGMDTAAAQAGGRARTTAAATQAGAARREKGTSVGLERFRGW